SDLLAGLASAQPGFPLARLKMVVEQEFAQIKHVLHGISLLGHPGSADLCFITSTPINDVVSEILQAGIPIVEGPVERTGATGEI
ncbi:hypothetical protein MJH54_29420, partial [Salmonella enterica subsp. enterica serovar Montevideo]|nr:hypothetical protein [Salmonella enterica subsp. enterica serovar Montevideo]